MTNEVKPTISLTGSGEVHFAAASGKGGVLELSLGYDESDTSIPYPGGATLTRSAPTVDLFTDAGCAPATRVGFHADRAVFTPAAIRAGVRLWARPTAPGDVDLTLALDELERAERDSRTTGAVAVRLKVTNSDPGGTRQIKVKPAAVVDAEIQLVDGDAHAWPTGKPTALRLGFTGSTTYDKGAELVLEPAGALKLYTDDTCTAELVLNAGKASLTNDLIKPGAAPIHARSATGLSVDAATLTLTLKPSGDPAILPGAVARQTLRIHPTTTLTAGLTAKALDLAFPTQKPRSLRVVVETSNPAVPVVPMAVLTRSSDALDLYLDKDMTPTKRVRFFAGRAVLGDLPLGPEGLKLFACCTRPEKVGLKLELQDPGQRAITLAGPPPALEFEGKHANIVAPVLDVEDTRVWFDPAGKAERTRAVRLRICESDPTYRPFAGSCKLVRSSAELQVFSDPACTTAVFSDTTLEATLTTAALKGEGKPIYVRWGAARPPTADCTLELALAHATIVSKSRQSKPDDAGIVLAPASETLPLVPTAVVTFKPEIRSEYDLVLLDRSQADLDVRTTPVRVHLSAQVDGQPALFPGAARLTRTRADLRVFLDDRCTLELAFHADVAALERGALTVVPRDCYVLGASAGKTGLKLALDDPNAGGLLAPGVAVDAEVTRELTVVAASLELSLDDRAQTPAVAVVMPRDERQRRGRALHRKDGTARFGRARLVIKAPPVGDWPGTASAHRLVVRVTGEQVRVFDAETGGSVLAAKDVPLLLGRTALASDTTCWVEGDVLSTKAGDARIDVGLDRSDGDFPGCKPLSCGDWAAFTVVRIARVTPDVDGWQQFVNMPPDRTLVHNTHQAEAKTGRAALVTAEIEPRVAGVGLEFMLWAHDGTAGTTANNTDLPDALKHDAKRRGALTDSDGKASVRVSLSRFGGDRFNAVAFLSDDARTGEAELGKQAGGAPDELKTRPLTVWRKLYWTEFYMHRHGVAAYDGDYQDRFVRADLSNTLEDCFLALESRVPVAVRPNVSALYDGAMPAGAQRAVLWADPLVPAIEDRSMYLFFIENIADGTADMAERLSGLAPVPTTDTIRRQYKRELFDTPVRARYLKPGTGKLFKTAVPAWERPIPDDRFSLADDPDPHTGYYRLDIDLTGLRPNDTPYADFSLRFDLVSLAEFCGMSLAGKPFVFTAVRYAEQRDAMVTEEVYSTVVHEIGHFLGLTAKLVPTAAQPGNALWYRGNERLAETSYYDRDLLGNATVERTLHGAIGQGPHCMHGYADFADLGAHHGSKTTCLMFDSTVNPPIVVVCAACREALRAMDLSITPADGQKFD